MNTCSQSSDMSSNKPMRHEKTLFDLPIHVRHTIWSHSGLVSLCPFDLSRELADVDRDEFRKCKGHCTCPPVPIGLLCSSRVIYEEALVVLIEMNHFISTGSPQRLLFTLQRLPAKALSCLKYLHISLSFESFYDLTDVGARGTEAKQTWDALFRYLGTHIPTKSLSLSLCFPAVSILAAKRLASVLRSLPLLKNCGIRLGRNRYDHDKSLQTLARITVGGLMGCNDVGFPLERAPWEIRNRIYWYTNLIQPTKRRKIRIKDGKMCGINSCCQKCIPKIPGDCCCIGNAAYSTSCVCTMIPAGLFVSNKQISSETLEICYRKNKFVLCEDNPISNLNFLQRISPVLRHQIRFIEFNVDYTNLQGTSWIEDTRRDWHRLCHFMNNHLNLPRLTLCIIDHWRPRIQDKSLKALGQEIFRPLHHMRGLERVLLHITGYDYMESSILEMEMTGEGITHLTAEEADGMVFERCMDRFDLMHEIYTLPHCFKVLPKPVKCPSS